jgi:hypothetical protein
MYLCTPVSFIHIVPWRIRLPHSPVLLNRLAEGYPKFHRSLPAPVDCSGGRGREGKAGVVKEWLIYCTELVDTAFALG